MIDGEFLATLVDCLAPGVDANLPAASMVGCDHMLAALMPRNPNLQRVVSAIATQAGGAQSFVACDPGGRIGFLEAVQREQPEGFLALVTATLAHYYAQPQILAALGWPARPPQPAGHTLLPFDETLLVSVKARGPIWRQC